MSCSWLAILAAGAAIICIDARALHSAADGEWQHAGGADQRADVASVHLAHKLHVAPAHAPGNVTRKPIAKLVARILHSLGVPTAATGRSRKTVAGLSATSLPATLLLTGVPLMTQPPNQHSCWAYSRAVAIGFLGLNEKFLLERGEKTLKKYNTKRDYKGNRPYRQWEVADYIFWVHGSEPHKFYVHGSDGADWGLISDKVEKVVLDKSAGATVCQVLGALADDKIIIMGQGYCASTDHYVNAVGFVSNELPLEKIKQLTYMAPGSTSCLLEKEMGKEDKLTAFLATIELITAEGWCNAVAFTSTSCRTAEDGKLTGKNCQYDGDDYMVWPCMKRVPFHINRDAIHGKGDKCEGKYMLKWEHNEKAIVPTDRPASVIAPIEPTPADAVKRVQFVYTVRRGH